MPRPPRVDYPGAWHHAMNRGGDHQRTFFDDTDRRTMLALTGELEARFAVQVHAYCLMTNHYHLLLRSMEANLSAAMQYLDALYTRRFNRRHDRDGALFRGRFASRLIDSDLYLARASAYIHRNPVDAGLVENALDHRWSSLPAYAGVSRGPGWLHTEFLLSWSGGRAGYMELMKEEAGVPEFLEAMELPVQGAVAPVGAPAPAAPPSIDVVEKAVAAAFAVDLQALYESRRGERNVPRMAAIAIGHKRSGLDMAELASRYGMASASSAASAVRRLRSLVADDPSLHRKIYSVTTALSRHCQELGV